MKKFVLFLSFIAAFGSSALFAATAPPVIFFSDLTSGPKTGGQNDKGAFVTIVGKNFGSSRGAGYVSVGGGQADNYPVWTDTKITFQLGANANTGNITVTSGGGVSNGIRFAVRAGRIFFVDDTSPNSPGSGTFTDPWRSPRSFFTSEQPGDICYFRGGLYSGQYGNSGRPYNVSFYGSGIPSGSPDNEIAWVGYPGETALFKADDDNVYNGAFELSDGVQYHVIAGLSIYGRGDGREQVRLYSDNNKLVNCRIEGIKTLSYAMIGITASHLKIWGNECFGATSQNKLDHIFYFQSADSDVDIGWNYVHDNDIAVGPMFSWNISGSADNIVIHDNKLDCRNSSDIVRLAGIWNGSGGSITFINNVIIGTGGSLSDDTYNGIYIGFAHVKIYNNTFYLSRGSGSNHVVHVYWNGSADVRNNIFYNQDSISYVDGNATVDSNCYYGGSGSIPSDAHAVSADPKFVNGGGLDFHLMEGSPVIGKGADITASVPRDYDGVPRLAGGIDIGAFQYNTAVVAPLPPSSVTHSLSGVVRDALGKAVEGVTIAVSGSTSLTTVSSADGSYSFTGLAENSAYTVTPTKDKWIFSPLAISIASLSADLAGQDFTGRRTFAIKGYVKDSHGTALKSVDVRLNGGGLSLLRFTDDSGYYEFLDLPESSDYQIATAKSGYYFSPSTRSTSTLAGYIDGWNFEGANVSSMLNSSEIKVVGSPATRGTVNPDRGETPKIYFKGNGTGKFECRIFTLTGEQVWQSSQDGISEGTFDWPAANVASGIYTAHVKGPGVNTYKKIAIIR